MKTSKLFLAAMAFVAAEARADFDQANAAFAGQRYAEAASGYEDVIRQNGYSAPVLFNLGSAYYLDGKLGRAILNYERAQLLAPRASDIAANLSIARCKAGIVEQPAHLLSTNELSWLGSSALVCFGAAVLWRQINARAGAGWIIASGCMLAAVMIALFLRYPESGRAIVVAKSAPAYIAPVTVTQPLFTLTEGQPVSIRKVNGDFLLVDAGNSRRGWVTPSMVERVTPM